MKKILASLTVGLVLASCAVTSPLLVTNNDLGSKEGRSETVCLFGWGGVSSGIVLNKDYSVAEAARKGDINNIGSVDIKVQNFYIFQKHTLIVTGE